MPPHPTKALSWRDSYTHPPGCVFRAETGLLVSVRTWIYTWQTREAFNWAAVGPS